MAATRKRRLLNLDSLNQMSTESYEEKLEEDMVSEPDKNDQYEADSPRNVKKSNLTTKRDFALHDSPGVNTRTNLKV